MPVIKKVIKGREFSFAPLKLGELKNLLSEEAKPVGVIDRVEMWIPLIQSSLTRAGEESIPDFYDMDLDEANATIDTMIRGVAEASGVKMVSTGEADPAASSPVDGTTSTVA